MGTDKVIGDICECCEIDTASVLRYRPADGRRVAMCVVCAALFGGDSEGKCDRLSET